MSIQIFALQIKDSLVENEEMGREVIATEGIVLKSLDFKEYHKIVSVYSKERGLIKLFIQHSKKRPLLVPLTKVELHLSKGRSDFYRLSDSTLLAQYLGLRQSLERIKTATLMIEAFCTVQWPEEPSYALFTLLDRYIAECAQSTTPTHLLSSFYLKLSKHEGILQSVRNCSTCNKELIATYRYRGESFCEKDAPPPALFFSQEEEEILQKNLVQRNFATLYQLAPSEEFTTKIQELFAQNFIG